MLLLPFDPHVMPVSWESRWPLLPGLDLVVATVVDFAGPLGEVSAVYYSLITASGRCLIWEVGPDLAQARRRFGLALARGDA